MIRHRHATWCANALMIGLVTLGSRADMVAQEKEGVECARTKTGRAQTQEQSADQSGWSLKRADQAVARARSLLGVTNSTKFPATAELVTLETDNTPYLSDEMRGRQLWRVTVSGWSLAALKSSSPSVKDRYVRTLDTFLDPISGRVLKVSTRWPDGEAPMTAEPTAARAVEQMLNPAIEKCHGLPAEPPLIPFIEAMRVIQEGGGNPLVAKRLVGFWVMWSTMEQKPRPMWVITLRGIPPVPVPYPGEPLDPRHHLRYVVDPVAKRWIYATTTP